MRLSAPISVGGASGARRIRRIRHVVSARAPSGTNSDVEQDRQGAIGPAQARLPELAHDSHERPERTC